MLLRLGLCAGRSLRPNAGGAHGSRCTSSSLCSNVATSARSRPASLWRLVPPPPRRSPSRLPVRSKLRGRRGLLSVSVTATYPGPMAMLAHSRCATSACRLNEYRATLHPAGHPTVVKPHFPTGFRPRMSCARPGGCRQPGGWPVSSANLACPGRYCLPSHSKDSLGPSCGLARSSRMNRIVQHVASRRLESLLRHGES